MNFQDQKFQDLSSFLKIISEPNRLKILFFLKNKEKCVCEIWKEFDLSQNLISHHLKILKDFNLVDSRQEGRKVIYFSNDETIKKYNLNLNNLLTKKL